MIRAENHYNLNSFLHSYVMANKKRLMKEMDEEYLEYFELFVSKLNIDLEKLNYVWNLLENDFGIKDIDDGIVYLGPMRAKVLLYIIYSILINYEDRDRKSPENST